MFIQTEKTPNPETLKFLPGRTVLETGTAVFHSYEEAMRSPLARALFNMDGVMSVFYGRDFISVTKAPKADWLLLKTAVMAAIMDHYMSGMPLLDRDDVPGDVPTTEDSPDEDSEIVRQIKEILDTRVRPVVAQDGGNIAFVRFEDGVVYLQMQGACAGCPSSAMTLKDGVERLLKHFLPEVRGVAAV